MLIDSHLHLTSEQLKTIPDVLEQANIAGVIKFITIGTNIADNEEVIDLIEKEKDVFGVVGLYPHENTELSLTTLENRLEEQLNKSKKIVGIGECGIDLPNLSANITQHSHFRKLEEQLKLFEIQIMLAIKYKLPIVIHNRNGDEEVLKLLEKYQGQGLTGVVHCFTSTWDVAEKFINLGFYISFSGIITYPTGTSIHQTVKLIPMNKFLVETDAPYLAPQPVRKKINEPKYVRMTANKVAEIKGVSQEIIEEAAYKNSCTLFKLPA